MFVVPYRCTGKQEGLSLASSIFLWENRTTVLATLVKIVKLFFANNKFILCKNLYMVPDFGKYLLSISRCLNKDVIYILVMVLKVPQSLIFFPPTRPIN